MASSNITIDWETRYCHETSRNNTQFSCFWCHTWRKNLANKHNQNFTCQITQTYTRYLNCSKQIDWYSIWIKNIKNFKNMKCHTFELKRNLKNGAIETKNKDKLCCTIGENLNAFRKTKIQLLIKNQIDLIIIGWQKISFSILISSSNTICYHEVMIILVYTSYNNTSCSQIWDDNIFTTPFLSSYDRS